VEHSTWILLAWTVFALAAGIKLWRLGTGLSRQLGSKPVATEPFRQSLERIWARDQDG
jgi:hypothetical protein